MNRARHAQGGCLWITHCASSVSYLTNVITSHRNTRPRSVEPLGTAFRWIRRIVDLCATALQVRWPPPCALVEGHPSTCFPFQSHCKTRHRSTLAISACLGPLCQAASPSARVAPRRHTLAKSRSAHPLQSLVADRQPCRTPH